MDKTSEGLEKWENKTQRGNLQSWPVRRRSHSIPDIGAVDSQTTSVQRRWDVQIQTYPSYLKCYTTLSCLPAPSGVQRLLFKHHLWNEEAGVFFRYLIILSIFSHSFSYLCMMSRGGLVPFFSRVFCFCFFYLSFIATSKQAGLVSKVPDLSPFQNPLKSLVGYFLSPVGTFIIPFTEKPE